jgi:predicted site-specific integrase-resolvase
MAKENQYLTTREFASRARITTSIVTKMIREGRIQAEKKSGKWRIAPNQLKSIPATSRQPGKPAAGTPPSSEKPASPKRQKSSQEQRSAAKHYRISEFAALTYLTEKGVVNWLKQGRLAGHKDQLGSWQVDAANLEKPDVKRLVR